MMPRPVLRLTILLGLLAAVLGLWAGSRHVTESDLIDAAAEVWAEETGGDVTTSCVGRVRESGAIWLEVACGEGERAREYLFDRNGQLVRDPAARI